RRYVTEKPVNGSAGKIQFIEPSHMSSHPFVSRVLDDTQVNPACTALSDEQPRLRIRPGHLDIARHLARAEHWEPLKTSRAVLRFERRHPVSGRRGRRIHTAVRPRDAA